MSRCLIVSLLLLAFLAGCEDRTPATSPSPTPTTTTIPPSTARALMQPVGVFLFNNCTFQSTCAFNATLVNNGQGCAIQVAGTVRLFDITGLQLGGSYRFSLPSQQIVQPAERVAYLVNFVPFDQAARTFTYSTEPNWVDTSCR